ncbi:MAG: hydrogenase assembly protein HupF [Geobacteraceae bacterium GWC2_58_44]|nr:MAG: hydrogenase assembly protein HupF [Geobacteraceae bacterium GWC2_58_44]HBG04750.1 hydrogenase assembly protein HupF [Geobacter sp.]
MCLGVPMRVVSIDGTDIVAEIDGVKREGSLMILDDEVQVGDFVIVHAGFAISKLDEEDAQESLRLLREALGAEDDEL